MNIVFVLPSEFRAPHPEELAVAQLDLGPQLIIFEKPKEKSYKHLKGLYLKGLIDGKPVNRMLVDTGATVNLMPYSGPVWERGQRKHAAYKQNAAPSSLFAILRPHVETSAYSATCGSQTRVQRRPFGGLILCFWLKRIAYAETNMPCVHPSTRAATASSVCRSREF